MSENPAERMAARLEVLATILRHPSGKTNEVFRTTFEEFNNLRKAYPELLTDEELSRELSQAYGEMDHMRERPFAETAGADETLSDRIERLNTEHARRFDH